MIDVPEPGEADPEDDVLPSTAAAASDADEGLCRVAKWFRAHTDLEEKFGSALRKSIDEVLDGQRTGRYDIDELPQPEKTYLGTKVEIVTRATFALQHGTKMDYQIDGEDVDAKFSLTGDWQIPPQAVGHLCLLISAKDRKQTFNVGLIRITPDVLNHGRNQDKKATITAQAKKKISWLCQASPLPANFLLSLPAEESKRIMQHKTGQRRIEELLRVAQRKIIDRNTAVTVAMQEDGLKRCRDARTRLAKEGIIVLSHQNDCPRIARSLGLPVPRKGSYVSARLIEVSKDANTSATAEIGGRFCALAEPSDPVEPAPPIRC